MTEFDDLAKARAALKRFVIPHTESVLAFYDETAKIFQVEHGEDVSAKLDKPVRRLTTTYTCLESVLEAQETPQADTDQRRAREEIVSFTDQSLKRTDLWESEGSAWIYSRARSLGAAVRHAKSSLISSDENRQAVSSLVSNLWEARDSDHGAFGIRELASKEALMAGSAGKRSGGYPPHAYLTYWTLLISTRLKDQPDLLPDDVDDWRKAAVDWLAKTLAEQMAFHEAGSTHTDPQQLAWCIAGLVLTAEPAELVNGARSHDLVSQALSVFFSQQSKRGGWGLGKPLFNYQYAGNAYCYTYETLAELLTLAVDPLVDAREGLSNLLKPYWPNLVKAFQYAEATALPLSVDGRTIGWGSNHHPHRPKPESWATASVFRFAQKLRVLLGKWTSEEAKKALGARQATLNLSDLTNRGGTWNMGFGSAGLQLSTNYVLPLLAQKAAGGTSGVADPDNHVIDESSGRSAILYGPPGTGKTSLVEAVAGALDWPFIEVNPAQFLDKGLDRVSARADLIFRQIMELDHCVVLLDEIDELVQNRNDAAESLERFFTTTMLPRLAKLWSMGKVMFFANTNNLLGVDTAIRRGQRFDAALLVMPPGWQAKRASLAKAGLALPDDFRETLEAAATDGVDYKGEKNNLRWFALTRFDQMPGLQRTLQDLHSDGTSVNLDTLAKALERTRRDLLAQDWYDARGEDGAGYGIVAEVEKLAGAQRRDSKLMTVVESAEEPPGSEAFEGASSYWKISKADSDDLEGWFTVRNLAVDPGGKVTKPE